MTITDDTLDYILNGSDEKTKKRFYLSEEEEEFKSKMLTLEIFERAKKYNIKHTKRFLREVEKAKEEILLWKKHC